MRRFTGVPIAAAILTGVAIAVAYAAYGPAGGSGDDADGAGPSPSKSDTASAATSSDVPSPFDVLAERTPDESGEDDEPNEAVAAVRGERDGGGRGGADGAGGAGGAGQGADPPVLFDTPLDVAAVGAAGWTDADFHRDAARLRADPEALALVIESFRAETDPARLVKLASLLGEVGHPDLAAIGADMVSSGNVVSRDAGLTLLQYAQPTDAAAREVLVGLLASESDPAVLKSVIDAVSVPGEGAAGVAGASAGVLVSQLVPLTRHDSPAVRRNGVTVLSRWAADENVTPVLRAALVDVDEGVRSSAVYAFADYPLVDEAVRGDLFAVLENPDEEAGIRAGALLALQRTELDAAQARRLEAARREMSRRRPADSP